MAAWGKGDPRWIVEDRPDATNPNNWHWTEKNATQWSKDKLTELLVGLKIENEQLSCVIKELKKCDGEASANNRKAKLVFLYEWHIEARWEGSLRMGENRTKYEGELEVPNLSDENGIDELTITFTAEKDKAVKFKEMMKKDGDPVIRQRLGEYVRQLKEEFAQGLILPTKNGSTTTGESTTSTKPKPSTSSSVDSTSISSRAQPTSNSSVSNSANKEKRIDTKELTLDDTFKCTRAELFQAFTDLNMVRAWTQDSVTVYDCKQGGHFSLFGDNITGYFLDITPPETIEMMWRFKSWPSEHFSQVTLSFIDENDQTKLEVKQKGIPAQFYDNTMDGWRRFYLQSIKSTFGYGARLI